MWFVLQVQSYGFIFNLPNFSATLFQSALFQSVLKQEYFVEPPAGLFESLLGELESDFGVGEIEADHGRFAYIGGDGRHVD